MVLLVREVFQLQILEDYYDRQKKYQEQAKKEALEEHKTRDIKTRLETAEALAQHYGACAEDARRAGIDNVSLDVMLGIGGQTVASACASVDTAAELGATHLSAYLLKIEPNTPYGACPPDLPSEDESVDLYHAAFDRMAHHGYHQYEISNAALPGRESRHNLKYWHCEEYLGIGAAAHSFADCKRFYYERSIEDFINGKEETLNKKQNLLGRVIYLMLCLYSPGVIPVNFLKSPNFTKHRIKANA